MTIQVVDPVPDALKRVALLNTALFRVLSGVRLIRVLDADYSTGLIRLLVEAHKSHPRVSGSVSVSYQPVDDAAPRRRRWDRRVSPESLP